MKQIIQTSQAPAAIGPYSQAVQAGNLLFVSGQIPLDPTSMQVVEGDIKAQTTQVLSNLEAILKQAGLTFEHVLKTTIFLKDLGDFEAVNQVYAKSFDKNPPARATIEVSRLPKDVLVEIEAVAASL